MESIDFFNLSNFQILGFVLAIFMGLSLGLIGGGGSILTVPILVYLFKVDPILASAYSLFIVGSTALVGGFNYYKKDEVDLKIGVIFAVPSFLGVFLVRSFVVPNLPSILWQTSLFTLSKSLFIMLIFSILMILASYSMIKRSPAKVQNSFTGSFELSTILFIGLEGLIVGSITGLVGAGGGFLIIPALVVLVGLPMKKAVGTSLFIIAVKSLSGFMGDLNHQPFIDWKLMMAISVIAVIGLIVGVKLSTKVPEKKLKVGFGYFVLIMGGIILVDQFSKLH